MEALNDLKQVRKFKNSSFCWIHFLMHGRWKFCFMHQTHLSLKPRNKIYCFSSPKFASTLSRLSVFNKLMKVYSIFCFCMHSSFRGYLLVQLKSRDPYVRAIMFSQMMKTCNKRCQQCSSMFYLITLAKN